MQKGVIPPNGVPVSPLPTGYTVVVNCDDGIHNNLVVDFGLGGGRSATAEPITGLAVGTVCTVVEQGTGAFPDGSVVSYSPAGADAPGVTIGAGAGVVIDVINDFSAVEVRAADIEITKEVVSAPGVTAPTRFTARLLCDDGQTDTEITLPGDGGLGTPTVSVAALSLCVVQELDDSIPAGWTVRYAVDGGEPTSEPEPFVVQGDTAVQVTITNDASGAVTSSTTTTATIPPADPAVVSGASQDLAGSAGDNPGSEGDTLADTGPAAIGLLIVGLISICAGSALTASSRRTRRRAR